MGQILARADHPLRRVEVSRCLALGIAWPERTGQFYQCMYVANVSVSWDPSIMKPDDAPRCAWSTGRRVRLKLAARLSEADKFCINMSVTSAPPRSQLDIRQGTP